MAWISTVVAGLRTVGILGFGIGLAARATLPTATALSTPPRRAAPSCVDRRDTSGSSRGDLSGRIHLTLSGQAFFRSASRAGVQHGLEIRLKDPELGRWQITFTLERLKGLPRTGDYPIVQDDSTARAVTGSGPGAAVGELYLFDPTALVGRRLAPVGGTVTLDAVDAIGICGAYDVTWRSRSGELGEIRTRGTFRAVNAGFGDRGGGG